VRGEGTWADTTIAALPEKKKKREGRTIKREKEGEERSRVCMSE